MKGSTTVALVVGMWLAGSAAASAIPRPSFFEEHGRPSEMKGRTLLFMDCDDFEFMAQMRDAIEKALPSVHVVDKFEKAQFMMSIDVAEDKNERGVARIIVWRASDDGKNARDLVQYSDKKNSKLTPSLVTILSRRFVNDYRKAQQ